MREDQRQADRRAAAGSFPADRASLLLLPTLRCGAGSFQLPLSHWAAGELAHALVCDAAERRQQILGAVIACEAPLALWSVLRMTGQGASGLPSLSDIAQWLSAGLPAELVGIQSLDDFDSSDGRARRVRDFANLAAESAGLAHLAAQLAATRKGDPQVARLLGLLHAAPRWLTLANSDPHSPVVAAEALPSGLAAQLSRIETHDAPPTSAAGCVVDALALVSDGKPPKSARKFDRAAHSTLVSKYRQHWKPLGEPCAALLPLVVAKLVRLRQLESDFQSALETEKLEALKELAYGAGHEINNPLANISLRAQTLLKDEPDPERQRKLAAIVTQAARAHDMIADMMLFARPPQIERETFDLRSLVGAVIEALSATAADEQVRLVFEPPAEPISISADRTQIAVVVRALCINALEAVDASGRIDVAIRAAELADPDPSCSTRTVQIIVADDGPGIVPEVRRHLFDPFYSGREAGRGLGFGLSKCWRIVTGHGGRIDIDSQPGHGATFTVTLPIGE